LSAKILLQGRLYVTTFRLCFHSYFNDNTLFGRETRIVVPKELVENVEQKGYSIIIILKEGNPLTFASFMAREEALKTL